MIRTLPLTASTDPATVPTHRAAREASAACPAPPRPSLPGPLPLRAPPGAVGLSLPFPPETEAPGLAVAKEGALLFGPHSFQIYGTLSEKCLNFQTWTDYFVKGGILVCLCGFPYFFLNKSKPCLLETNILVNTGISRGKKPENHV